MTNPNLSEKSSVEADWVEEKVDYQKAQDIRDCPYKIGKNYYMAMTTFAVCGTVRYVGEKEIVLNPAARIFDSGRFADVMRDGFESDEQSEIEPTVGELIVGRLNVSEAYEYAHPVPTEQK